MTKPVLLCGPHSSFLSTVIYLFSQLASRVIKLFERTYLIKEIVIIIMLSGAVVTLFCMIVGASAFTVEEGVDISSPMHHAIQNRSSMFAKRHEETMAQCYATYSQTECEIAEQQRLATNRDQPKMQHNYTEVGFKLSRVPDSIMQDIQKFYQDNKDREQPEIWTRGFSSINSWVSPTTMVRLEDPTLEGGIELRQRVLDTVKPIISKWTGHELIETSLYGIRVYREGAILATHVDRIPLVSSAIIQVAQDVNEPWPVEMISHDGQAYNITMNPGDMVLYESHTVLHGRPYPLSGKFYANIFVHFIPVDHNEMNEMDQSAAAAAAATDTLEDIPSLTA